MSTLDPFHLPNSSQWLNRFSPSSCVCKHIDIPLWSPQPGAAFCRGCGWTHISSFPIILQCSILQSLLILIMPVFYSFYFFSFFSWLILSFHLLSAILHYENPDSKEFVWTSYEEARTEGGGRRGFHETISRGRDAGESPPPAPPKSDFIFRGKFHRRGGGGFRGVTSSYGERLYKESYEIIFISFKDSY